MMPRCCNNRRWSLLSSWLVAHCYLAEAAALVIPSPAVSRRSGDRQRAFFRMAEKSSDDDNDDGISVTGNSISIANMFNGDRDYFVSGYRGDGYSRSLDRKRNKKSLNSDDDGYEEMYGKKNQTGRKRFLLFPFRLIKRALHKIVPKAVVPPGTLILVRHGESEWNANKTFTGWADPDLSERGHREVEHAARLLLEGGYEIDVVFTSRLTRAVRSSWILLQELNEIHIPVFKSWRLNERMYGALTGLSKKETAVQLGVELVQQWRGSLHARPPALQVSDRFWPGRDRRHFDLTSEQIPLTESLHDCMERTAPVWDKKICSELRAGRNVMVVAHANTLRGLAKIIDNIGDEEIQEVAIPTGIPIIYKFDNEMVPIQPSGNSRSASQLHMSGLFLEKPGLLKEALKREEEWTTRVPGYDNTMNRSNTAMTPLERSLSKLEAERELGKWAGQFLDTTLPEEDDGSDGNMGKPVQYIDNNNGVDDDEDDGERDDKKKTSNGVSGDYIQRSMNGVSGDYIQGLTRPKPSSAVPTTPSKTTAAILEEEPVVSVNTPTMITNANPCLASVPPAAMVQGMGSVPIRKDAVIVIIRHGKTEHNKLGLFTGWADVPLAKEGVEEAKAAGKLLKMHGFEFDVVYTSWLARAIDTAWCVLDELDCLWLPIIKSWRLNERMYGNLTGLSKRMVAQRHGDEQFKAWRRGYNVRPPAVSSFSPHYPGNDKRYKKYLRDVRLSFSESLIRSIEGGKISTERKLPKTESLKDCMDRTIPYFAYQIVPEAINQGKRVLISSSENAIRGLLMHLCEIPEENITELEIPNGLPLIFDVKSKCVKLLDDGTGRDPLEVYNFGKAANYLFRPCTNDDGTPDEECDIRFMGDSFKSDASTRDVSDFIGRPSLPSKVKV